MTTGEFLATLRRAGGLTQKDVAEKLGVSDRTLSSWETDRTCPDMLLLPALADLYGVTVDDILRGERSAKKTDENDLGEKSLRALRKRNYGKFSAKCALLCGLGLVGSLLFVISSVLLLFTSSPLWLDILLAVIGFLDFAVCLTLLFYFEYSARISEGIVLDEDYSEDKKRYTLALKRRACLCLALSSLPFILGGVIFLLIFVLGDISDYTMLGFTVNIVTPYLITSFVNLALGIIPLFASFIYKNVCVEKFGSEKQLEIYGKNKKFARKIFGFGTIPVGVFLILFIIFSFVTPTSNYIARIERNTFQELKETLQTVEVTESDLLHTQCGVQAGEYYLDFPESDFNCYEVYPLGGRWYGHYHHYYKYENAVEEFVLEWRVYYLKPEVSEPPEVNSYGYIDNQSDYFYDYYFSGESIYCYTEEPSVYIVNMTDYDLSDSYYTVDYGFGIWANGSVFYAKQPYGKYGIYECEILYLDVFFLYVLLIATAVYAVTAASVYFAKRKKQNYGF